MTASAQPTPSTETPSLALPLRDLEWAEENDLGQRDLEDPEVQRETLARELANRYLRALGGLGRAEAADEQEHRATVARLAMRHEARLEVWARRRVWLQRQLQTLARFIPRRGKAKSVTLLEGRIGERHRDKRLVVDDPKAALAWAQQHCRTAVEDRPHLVFEPLAYRLIDAPAAELADAGCHVEAATDSFYATPTSWEPTGQAESDA